MFQHLVLISSSVITDFIGARIISRISVLYLLPYDVVAEKAADLAHRHRPTRRKINDSTRKSEGIFRDTLGFMQLRRDLMDYRIWSVLILHTLSVWIWFNRIRSNFLIILLLTSCDKDPNIPALASHPISLKNFRSVLWNVKQCKY